MAEFRYVIKDEIGIHARPCLLYTSTDYVLCIFSQTSEYSGITGIKQISAKVYQALN